MARPSQQRRKSSSHYSRYFKLTTFVTIFKAPLMSCSTSQGQWKHPLALSSQDRVDVGGKTLNFAIQLVLRFLLLPVLPYRNACSIIIATHHLYIFVRSQAQGTLRSVSYPGKMYRCNLGPFERNRIVNWMNISHFKRALFLFWISVKPMEDRDIFFYLLLKVTLRNTYNTPLPICRPRHGY